MSGVIIPVHVAALRVGRKGQGALLATANFSRLSQLSPTYAYPVYPTPYTGAQVSQETYGTLTAGIHLHWKLPDALATGEQPTQDDPVEFPPVPNRWLVTRMILRGPELISSRQWVIESDRLNKADPLPGLIPPTVTVPVVAEDADPSVPGDVGAQQAYRFLGQRFDADRWAGESRAAGEDVEYLGRPREHGRTLGLRPALGRAAATARTVTPYGLTSIGYGEETFASFYPNCSSVFGFCDRLTDLQANGFDPARHSLSYHVAGWYGDAGQDVVRQPRNRFRFAPPDAPPAGGPAAVLEAYEQALQEIEEAGVQPDPDEKLCFSAATRWLFKADSLQEPSFSVYSGSVPVFGYEPSVHDELPLEIAENEQVTIGNTVNEAVSALLSARLGVEGLEPLVNALQLGALHLLSEPGGADHLRRLLHQSWFSALPGGSRWEVVPSASRPPGGEETAPPLTPGVQSQLLDLNREQRARDQLAEELASRRRQLMADWQKYLYLMHSGSFAQGTLHDALKKKIGTVRRMMQAQADGIEAVLKDLSAATARVGTLRGDIQAELARPPLSGSYELEAKPAPSFWSPAEPTLLVAGPVVDLKDHGKEDGRLRPDDYLEIRAQAPSGATRDVTLPLKPSQLGEHRDELARYLEATIQEGFMLASGRWSAGTLPSHQVGVCHDVDEWNPLLLKWLATCSPLARSGATYPGDHLLKNYLLEPALADLWPKAGHTYETTRHEYRGLTSLSAGVSVPLVAQIDACLHAIDDPGMKERLEALRDGLSGCDFLAQSLGGFHAAQLMRVQRYQLPVCDNLAVTPVELSFSSAMYLAIAGEQDLGEDSNAPYNPLRSGRMTLAGVSIVDCFGRAHDLKMNQPVVAQTLQPFTEAEAQLGWMHLPPRVTQPSRLTFQWAPAASGAQSPVCGWVMFNRFDNSLWVYSAQGHALGTVQMVDREGRQAVHWQGAPGRSTWSQSADVALQGQNEHLRKLVSLLLADASRARQMMAAIDRALALSPRRVDADANASLLLSKPLALTRARLQWEVQGLPAPSQSWVSFNAAVDDFSAPRETLCCEDVRVPLQLGAFSDLDDGLIGFFTPDDDTFYSHAAASRQSHVARPHDGVIPLRLDAQETELTLLMDPLGKVHARSGLLPDVALELPPAYHQGVLQRLQSTLLVAPLISREIAIPDPDSRSAADTYVPALPMPAPDESLQGGSWTWLEVSADRWRRLGLESPARQAAVSYGSQNILEGWLSLDHTEGRRGKDEQ